MFWKRFWQVWFVLAFFVVHSAIFTFNPDNQEFIKFMSSFHFNILDITNIILETVSLMGIFGFAWNIKLFNKKFWQTLLPTLIVFNFIYAFTMPVLHLSSLVHNSNNHILWFIGITTAIFSLLNILVYLPLAFYGFKRNNLWDNTEIKPFSLWKALFLFVVLFTFIPNYLLLLFHFNTLNLYEQLDFITGILLLTGIYSFAWNKRIFTRIFWQIFFIGYIIWFITYWFVLPHSNIYNLLMLPIYNSIIFQIFQIIYILLIIIFLFNYSFRAENIWNPSITENSNQALN